MLIEQGLHKFRYIKILKILRCLDADKARFAEILQHQDTSHCSQFILKTRVNHVFFLAHSRNLPDSTRVNCVFTLASHASNLPDSGPPGDQVAALA